MSTVASVAKPWTAGEELQRRRESRVVSDQMSRDHNLVISNAQTTRMLRLSVLNRFRAWSSSFCEAAWASSAQSAIKSTASWSVHTSHNCERGRDRAPHQQRRLGEIEEGKVLTPSQATMRKSSCGPNVVSVVYGEPTTNSFIDESPRDLVTARTPTGFRVVRR